jgi:hypothetical protein
MQRYRVITMSKAISWTDLSYKPALLVVLERVLYIF